MYIFIVVSLTVDAMLKLTIIKAPFLKAIETKLTLHNLWHAFEQIVV